ncbi:MAG: protein TolQ [Pseudomonadota bacterium]
MESQIVDAASLGGSVPTDLSLWALFMKADIVVKGVMVLLLVASIVTWGIIFDKLLKVRRLETRARKFEEAFWSGGSLEDLYERVGNRPRDPMSAIFAAAMREWRRSSAKGAGGASDPLRVGLQQRIDRVMHVTLGREIEQLEKYMTFLATVGSSAPFIGLFGTVWGIMNAFVAIAGAKNTTLAVVAPGIAEALFATALGLIAAIPAVIGYNKISTDLGRYGNRLDNFSGEFGTILSRQLEEARR